MKEHIMVVLEFVDDSDIQVKYYLDGKLLDINYLNELFYKNEESSIPYKEIVRFKCTHMDTHYINRARYKHDQYINYGGIMKKVPTLPSSINIENILEGICEMNILSTQYGGFKKIHIRYNNLIKEYSKSRNGDIEDDALLLILQFLRKNNISMYGLKFNNMSLDKFHDLMLCIEMILLDNPLNQESNNTALDPLNQKIYGKILEGKIKNIVPKISSKSDNQNLEKEENDYII